MISSRSRVKLGLMKKYFEYTDAVSNKFWEINLKGKQVTLTYGRIGIKNPAQIVKNFKGKSASEDAKKYAEGKIGEKIRKGYLES